MPKIAAARIDIQKRHRPVVATQVMQCVGRDQRRPAGDVSCLRPLWIARDVKRFVHAGAQHCDRIAMGAEAERFA